MQIKLYENQWQGTKEELIARIENFKKAREDHKNTVDKPAPLEDPLIEQLATIEDDLEITILENPEITDHNESLEYSNDMVEEISDDVELLKIIVLELIKALPKTKQTDTIKELYNNLKDD